MTKDLHLPDNESLIEFPCDFCLKAMGHNTEEFIDLVFEVTQKYAPSVTRENIHIKDSKAKKFISVNITFYATCIEQIHGIYGDLKKHPQVLMTL
ncbi:MAG: DUF493 domain-containing protein [Thiomicrorhabdus chilensis]|uniref:YbeD family protein n=1 Tax=Thiomicrorhabdus chilensis TaxID=63656 RepID=UPI00041C890F|nr:DUF493 domain-containing protein [Thiomicrorhabdus chilensis]MDX1347310.1 DUF493 domain-containing protein [Thiomicrorhabdus chilensis]